MIYFPRKIFLLGGNSMETAKSFNNVALQIAVNTIESIACFIRNNHYSPDALILNFCEGYPALGVVFQKPGEPSYKFHLFSEPISYIEDPAKEKEFVEAVSSLQGPAKYVPSEAHENSFYSWQV